MTGDATRDNKPDSHHWGGPDEPMEDEYAQHAREERERKQRERQDAAHEKAKAEHCPKSTRVDGPWHSWQFDGDDPYVVCVFCGKRQDALTARVIP